MTGKNAQAAPMAAAPTIWGPDGLPAWGEMWGSFCALALDDGPPHRGEVLTGDRDALLARDTAYARAALEIARGIGLTTGLEVAPRDHGWAAVSCDTPEMADWLALALVAENVAAAYDRIGDQAVVLVPVGMAWTIEGEIKSVITAVAKTHHYYLAHIPRDVALTMARERRAAEAPSPPRALEATPFADVTTGQPYVRLRLGDAVAFISSVEAARLGNALRDAALGAQFRAATFALLVAQENAADDVAGFLDGVDAMVAHQAAQSREG